MKPKPEILWRGHDGTCGIRIVKVPQKTEDGYTFHYVKEYLACHDSMGNPQWNVAKDQAPPDEFYEAVGESLRIRSVWLLLFGPPEQYPRPFWQGD